MIRARAGLDLAVNPGEITVSQAKDIVYKEWIREFAMEGQSWAVMKRLMGFTATTGAASYKALWPIPQAVLDIHPNLKQNPGY